MANLEIKKMKQGMSYSSKEKTIILNVFKYFRSNFPEKCVTDIVRTTAKATGCSEKSIFQFRKEEASGKGFKEPSKTKIRKSININSRDIKYDNSVRQAIRNIIYDLKYRNIIPSLNTILKQVNNDNQLPNFSLMTLRRLMFDMGFYYEKDGNKSILTEKNKKENIPAKPAKPLQNANNQAIVQPPKTVPASNQNVCNIPPPHHVPLYHHQEHMPVQVPVHEPHMMTPMHPPSHSMPFMLNHQRDFLPNTHAPNASSYVKLEYSSWMQRYDVKPEH